MKTYDLSLIEHFQLGQDLSIEPVKDNGVSRSTAFSLICTGILIAGVAVLIGSVIRDGHRAKLKMVSDKV